MKSAYCDPRLDEPVEPLSNNIRAREELSKFLPRQKPNLFHEASCSSRIGARPSPPASLSPQDGYAHCKWKPLPADEVKMRLYREPIIRRLYPKRLSDTLNFPCHLALVFEREQVFDDRIAKSYIHAAIAELSEIPGVTGEWGYVRVPPVLCDEVQSEDLDVRAPVPAPIFPKRVRATYVEKPQRSRQARSKGLKLPETLRAKLVRERCRLIDIGQSAQHVGLSQRSYYS